MITIRQWKFPQTHAPSEQTNYYALLNGSGLHNGILYPSRITLVINSGAFISFHAEIHLRNLPLTETN